MRVLLRAALAASGSAAVAAAIAVASPIPASAIWPRLSFPPDLLAIGQTLFAAAPEATAIAGGIAGLAGFIAIQLRGSVGAPALAVALFNPLTLYAYSLGPAAALALAAELLWLGAFFNLVLCRDHRATVILGIATAIAPLISNSSILLIPLAVVLAPALSPWRVSPRRLVGFATAVLAPFALACIALLYLGWLLGPMEGTPVANGHDGGVSLMILVGAALVAMAGRALAAQIGAFVVGGAAVLIARPGLVVRVLDLAP